MTISNADGDPESYRRTWRIFGGLGSRFALPREKGNFDDFLQYDPSTCTVNSAGCSRIYAHQL